MRAAALQKEITRLEKLAGLDYQTYKQEHPKTHKTPGDPLFRTIKHHLHHAIKHWETDKPTGQQYLNTARRLHKENYKGKPEQRHHNWKQMARQAWDEYGKPIATNVAKDYLLESLAAL